ncbi:glycosyltransferase family 4 protein [Curtobacterium pusillum]|uniref:Glycosyltransferase family 4 protein n=1 Tax=Curtobacterium pusillum TaxID=69373 RepID=A0ABX2M958_9MICO|nr:glycosyltransferase family 4 protein [Curtobacterium pusillum]NUU14582.1 glycosyltransferase family 4 protein [Curtobacterium pusillum]
MGIGNFESGFQSGRPRAVYRAAEQVAEVVPISLPAPSVIARGYGRVLNVGSTTRRLPDRDLRLLRAYSSIQARKINEIRPDVVISTTTLSFLEPLSVPSASWADAPFNLMIGQPEYPVLFAGSRRLIRQQCALEARLLSNCTIAAFPTSAGCSAANELAPRSRVEVLPFGQNVSQAAIAAAREARQRARRDPGNALFIGLDWVRKGGPLALRVVEVLNSRGFKMGLTVIGRCPPAVAAHPLVTFVGELDLERAADFAIYCHCIASASFFLFPSRADNFGAVVSEMAAMGVPVLADPRTGASEYVEKGHFGLVAPGHVTTDEVALEDWFVSAGQALLDDDEMRLGMSDRGITASMEVLNYGASLRRLLKMLIE